MRFTDHLELLVGGWWLHSIARLFISLLFYSFFFLRSDSRLFAWPGRFHMLLFFFSVCAIRYFVHASVRLHSWCFCRFCLGFSTQHRCFCQNAHARPVNVPWILFKPDRNRYISRQRIFSFSFFFYFLVEKWAGMYGRRKFGSFFMWRSLIIP